MRKAVYEPPRDDLDHSSKKYKNQTWLTNMYQKELEVWEIAQEAGTTVKMIHEWLRKFGLYSMDEPEFQDEYPRKNDKMHKFDDPTDYM